MTVEKFDIVYPAYYRDILFYVLSALKNYIEKNAYSRFDICELLYGCINTAPVLDSTERTADDIEDAMDNATIFFPEKFKELIKLLNMYGYNHTIEINYTWLTGLPREHAAILRYTKNLLNQCKPIMKSFKIRLNIRSDERD